MRFCEPGGSLQLNRASRYVLLAGSQAAGAPGSSIVREVKRTTAERTTPTLYAANGTAAGHDPQAGIMIPTLMARHRVKRPAISMEGGTKKHILRSGLPRRRLFFAFDIIVTPLIRTKQECGFCRLLCLTVRHIFLEKRGQNHGQLYSWPYGRRLFRRGDHVRITSRSE